MLKHITILSVGLILSLAGCCKPALPDANAWTGRYSQPDQDLEQSAVDLQKLIDDTRDGGVVRVPLGRYVLDRPLRIRQRKDLDIEFAPGTQVRMTDANQDVILIENCTNVRLSGCRARHVAPLAEYECHGSVLRIRNSTGVVIENCELNGCGAVGVNASGVKDLEVVNCHLHHNSFTAFYLDKCEEVKIVGNIIEDNKQTYQAHGCAWVRWSDNLVRNNGGYWQKPRPAGLLRPAQ